MIKDFSKRIFQVSMNLLSHERFLFENVRRFPVLSDLLQACLLYTIHLVWQTHSSVETVFIAQSPLAGVALQTTGAAVRTKTLSLGAHADVATHSVVASSFAASIVDKTLVDVYTKYGIQISS